MPRSATRPDRAAEACGPRPAAARVRRGGWLSVAALTLATLAVAVGVLPSWQHTPDTRLPLPLLAVLFALSELDGRRRVSERRSLTSAASRVPLVLGLFLADPLHVLIAQQIGTAVVLASGWRDDRTGSAFTLAGSGFATACGAWSYIAMHPVPPATALEGWVEGFAAAGVVLLLSSMLAVVRGGPAGQGVSAMLRWARPQLTSDAVAVALGIGAVELLLTDRYGPLLLVLAGSAVVGMRRQGQQAAWRADALDTLHRMVDDVRRSSDRSDALHRAMAGVRSITAADSATLRVSVDGAVAEHRAGPAPRGLRDRPGAAVLGPHEATAHIELRAGIHGTLTARRERGRPPFSRAEVELLEILAAQLGRTLDLVHRLDRLEDERSRQEHAARELERENAQLQRQGDLRALSLSVTSHELRAPLTALLAEAELLDRMIDDPAQRDAVRRLVDGVGVNSRVLWRLVNDLVDLARIEAGRLELRLADVDLARIADEVVASFAPPGSGQDTKVRRSGVASARVHGDPERLWQVIANLVDNARRAVGDTGNVEVEVAGTSSEVSVSVRDTGPGIASADLARIFAPFEQAGARHGGLGLGLTIARHLVEGHAGRLIATSAPGAGSAFTATFPRAVSEPVPIPPTAGQDLPMW